MNTTADSDRARGDESLADRAYRAIRDRLILLDIKPGTALNDDLLGQELGIGRTPVREALKRLEADRLVASFPRRGTFATSVDITDLAEISVVRERLEPLAARLAAESATAASRERLRELAELLPSGQALSEVSQQEIIDLDITVHRAIYAAAGNSHLEDTLVRYDNLATRIWCIVLERLPRLAGNVTEHVEMLHLIIEGRADEAEALARHHVVAFEKMIRAAL